MEFRALGPLDVRAVGGPVELGGPRQRAVLAALLLRANELASVEYLTGAAWESPPATPESNLRTYVSGLRQRLAQAGDDPGRLSTRPGGYLLRVDRGELDLTTFTELTVAGETASGSREAASCFSRALALWRGRPLEGLHAGQALSVEVTRLEERRLAVVEKHLRARLDLGEHADLIAELRRLVADHPLREELWGHLMTALHRSGRRADALSAYQELHRLLDDELGVTPGRSLRQLQAQILEDDARIAPKPTIGVVRQLPPAINHFTGRRRQLAEIVTTLTGEDKASLPIAAVTGQPGAGKSALAIKAGHELAESFPDGQLFIDLLGAGSRPRDPGDVLARFLRELGVPGVDIPSAVDERESVFRARLAGKRVLIVLDNAADEAQIRPLLPGNPDCAVVVTSRRRLTGLDLSLRIQLGELDLDDAVTLLTDLAGSSRETLAAQRIVRCCGNLPLAIRIIGTKLRTLPHLSAETIADRLEDERHRLDELVGGDREVRAGFLVSYEQLRPDERRAFRLLALLPGTDFASWAAAAVLGTDRRTAERLLDALVEANLVEVGSPLRYRFHDLIRLLAEERMTAETSPEAREAALDRVFETYLQVGQRADAALDFGGLHQFEVAPPAPEIDALATEFARDAPAWFDSEHHCILEAVEMAAAEGRPEITCHLSATVAAYFELRSRWDDLIRVAELSLAASRRTGDMYWTAYAYFALGLAARDQHDVRSAREHFGQCLAALPAANDPRLEMVTLLAVGVGQRYQGHYDASADCIRACLAKLSTMDEPRWVAYAKRELGILHRYRGEWADAQRCLQEAIDEFVLIADRRWEAACLRELSVVHRELGELDSALRLGHTSRGLFHELGDVRREGAAWRSLAYAYRAQGETGTAQACARRSADLFALTLDVHGAAITEVLQAEFIAEQGEHAQALQHVRHALTVFEQLGDPRWTGKAQLCLGSLLADAGKLDQAREAWRDAHTTLTSLEAVEMAEAEKAITR
ncbi:BTAD domain-containing putative transcriptional regulator [Amycolatopsis sp. cg5]|uniref:AfsR/SARP family transcriptional regulator n=1 Tax=Amycolatopsis sp. cg5 TaxID=3238802 RepID=UPI003525DC0A